MKAIHSRIRRLQQRLCPEVGQEQRLWVTKLVGSEFALDRDRCIEILDECGFLPRTRFGVLSFCGIPDGLNAKELETFLRRNGASTRGSGQEHSGAEGAGRPPDSSWSNQAQMASDGT